MAVIAGGYEDSLDAVDVPSRRRRPPTRLWVGAASLLVCVLASGAVPPIVGMKPDAQSAFAVLQAPSVHHLFGTDALGRDVLARVLSGMRVSLLIGAAVSLATFVIGMPLGVWAAYSRIAGAVIMRVADAMMSVPAILLALAMVAIVRPGIVSVVAVLIVVWTPLTVRMARGAALEVLGKEYVVAAVAAGVPTPMILWRHVVRNAVDAVLVQQTVAFAGGILGEATFSFVGAGIQPPAASLGSVLADAQQVIGQAAWITLAAGGALSWVILSVILLGDGIRDYLAGEG